MQGLMATQRAPRHRAEPGRVQRGLFTSIYVHVPFCASKCDYCAFYSITDLDPELYDAFMHRVENELEAARSESAMLESVFIGGGTPSVLTESQLRRLLRTMHRTVLVNRESEFTVEVNPESLTQDKVELLAMHGVNRVSMGVQTFQPDLRGRLGRAGDVGACDRALAWIGRTGIERVSMDLMYGIPGQTIEDWRQDLRRALDCGIEHLSTYALTVDEGTALARRGVNAADEDAFLDFWNLADEMAGEAGLKRYEVSNLARPGAECRHNLAIWYGGTYAGCGPAASSFDGTCRWTNCADIRAWLAGRSPDVDRLAPEARAAEILAFGLRTARGWDLAEFRGRTGMDALELRGPVLRGLVEHGLLSFTDGHVRPTRRGLLLADVVAEELL